MAIPEKWAGRLKLPVVAAPMFLVSDPALVLACCRAGLVGTFPALNQRTTAGFEQWLVELNDQLGAADAPWGVNLIVHKTNPRVAADLEKVVQHRVPLVITSMGAAKEVVDAVHSYGGLIFHDVIGMKHAEKAAQAGVDGLILVAAGAGGHAGTTNPFALVSEVRFFFDGTLLLAGAISSGEQIYAARALGADLVYMGTRFLATRECSIQPAYREMLMAAEAADIVYTPSISGVPASFLRQSLVANGLDPGNLPAAGAMDVAHESASGSKAWKTIWSAGQGVGALQDTPSVAELTERLGQQYRAAAARMQVERCGFHLP